MAPLPQYRNALPPQTSLHEYRLEQVLGAGGFGMTYLARDTHLDKQVAIKEYLPAELAMRAPDGSVQPHSTQREADCYFEANGTAYMVMDYERGEPLKNVLVLNPQIAEAELRRLLDALLAGLSEVHAAGFLHRDIKPDNVFIRADGTPVLIDFGAARNALGGETRSLTAVLTPGYAPLEQYSGDGRQGPWTDLYALGGVVYRALTGEPPPDAVGRLRSDAVPANLARLRGKFSDALLHAVEWALALEEKKRPEDVAQWRAALLGQTDEKTLVVQKAPPKRRWPWVAGASAAAALVVLAAGLPLKSQRPVPAETAGAQPAAVQKTALQDKLQRLRQEFEAEFKSADVDRDGFLSVAEAGAFHRGNSCSSGACNWSAAWRRRPSEGIIFSLRSVASPKTEGVRLS